MKSRTIYSYLQRSLVKIFTKSINLNNKHKILLGKPPYAVYYRNRIIISKPAIKSKDLVSLLTRYNKSVNFLKQNTAILTKSFIGKFYLMSFNKSMFIILPKFFKTILLKTNINFAFYSKQKALLFCESFYIRKNEYKNSLVCFLYLYDFFSFFSFNSNKKISFLDSALYKPTQIKQAKQVLYLYKTSCVSNFRIQPHFYDTDTEFIPAVYPLRNNTNTTNENLCTLFEFLSFLTLFFYIVIKYIKQKKKQKKYKQPIFYENKGLKKIFKRLINNDSISFKCFYYRKSISVFYNSHYFFLMRPLFSITRLDTFFICESLKLPVYPDKSNLRVDFLRNRIRKQILPSIRILLNPQFDTILCKFKELDV